MGKWANDRRRLLFEQLKAEGRLNKPVYKPKKSQPRKRKPKSKPLLTPEQRRCCLYKYNGNLPDHFRACPDCPVTVDSRT